MPTTPAPMNNSATSAFRMTVTTRQIAAITHCTGSSMPQLGEPIAGMQDQCDHGRAHAVEDRGHRLEVPEIDVERAQRCDDHKIWENESPTAGPCSPEAAAQVGDVDAHLNGKRPRQRLADGDGFAHLLARQPTTLRDQLAFHLSHKCDGSAKAQQPQAQKVDREFADAAASGRCLRVHIPTSCATSEKSRSALLQRIALIKVST